jgi:hypothetical protein
MPKKVTIAKLPTLQTCQALVTIDTAIHSKMLEKIQLMNQDVIDKLTFIKNTDMAESIIYLLKETACEMYERVEKLEDAVQRLAIDEDDKRWEAFDGVVKKRRRSSHPMREATKLTDSPQISDDDEED